MPFRLELKNFLDCSCCSPHFIFCTPTAAANVYMRAALSRWRWQDQCQNYLLGLIRLTSSDPNTSSLCKPDFYTFNLPNIKHVSRRFCSFAFQLTSRVRPAGLRTTKPCGEAWQQIPTTLRNQWQIHVLWPLPRGIYLDSLVSRLPTMTLDWSTAACSKSLWTTLQNGKLFHIYVRTFRQRGINKDQYYQNPNPQVPNQKSPQPRTGMFI